MTSTTLRLSAYYLNTRRLVELTGADIPVVAQISLNRNSGERAAAMRVASQVANQLIHTVAVPPITTELNDLKDGDRMLASHWGSFTFKGLSKALIAERDGKRSAPGSFTSSVEHGDKKLLIEGTLSNDHVVSDTSAGLLSRQRKLFTIGMFERRADQLEVFPYLIGDLVEDIQSAFRRSWGQLARLHPVEIDAFSKLDATTRPTAAELSLLKTMPEAAIKQAFAEIIGEPFVPKDWGGENSDLTTSRLTVSGNPLTAAFIFKGPGMPGPLYPGKMGKNGDQLPRAFDEPVDLVVVQHHDRIESSVVKLAEAFASQPMRLRRYCIIDGHDTAHILKAYGRLTVASN